MRSGVMAKFSVVGFHLWPDAPNDVYYLRAEHRHLFVFRVYVETADKNRGIEFHTLRAKAMDIMCGLYTTMRYVNEAAFNFKSESCEQIADKLAKALMPIYNAPMLIDVSEDDENSGFVELFPDDFKV